MTAKPELGIHWNTSQTAYNFNISVNSLFQWSVYIYIDLTDTILLMSQSL